MQWPLVPNRLLVYYMYMKSIVMYGYIANCADWCSRLDPSRHVSAAAPLRAPQQAQLIDTGTSLVLIAEVARGQAPTGSCGADDDCYWFGSDQHARRDGRHITCADLYPTHNHCDRGCGSRDRHRDLLATSPQRQDRDERRGTIPFPTSTPGNPMSSSLGTGLPNKWLTLAITLNLNLAPTLF